MSIMDTGFVSEAQEKYLMKNEPELYKAVIKKHGSLLKSKKQEGISLSSSSVNVPRGRRRR